MYRTHRIARQISLTGIVGAGLIGFIALVGSVNQWMSTRGSDEIFARAYRDEAVFSAIAGGSLVAYSVCGAALWVRPRTVFVIAARLLFSVGGAVMCALMLRSAILYLSQSHAEECGLPAVAALAFCVMGLIFISVEVASWVGWWQMRARPAG